MLDNVLGRCSDILVDFQARHNLSRAAFAVFVVFILIGVPEIIEIHAKLPNNTAAIVASPLGSSKDNSAFSNGYQQIANKTVNLSNTTVNLSNTTDAFNPRMCAVANIVYIIWEDRGAGMSIVSFKRSIDNGGTFGHAVRLSSSIDYSTHPEITASGKFLYVIWQRYNSDILLRKSTDNGTTFGPAVKVTDITGNAEDLHLAASGDNFYVLWKDAGSGGILLKKSTNGGVSFGSVLKLTDDTSPALNPRIYAYGPTLYIIWTKADGAAGRSIMLLKTAIKNEISTLTHPIKLTNSTEDPSSNSLRIASWGKNVFVLWEDDAIQHKSAILLKQSIDNGTTFGPAINLSNNNTQNLAISFNPDIAMVDNNLYIKYQDILSGILLKKSADAGVSFGPATKISNSTAVSHLNIAAAENGFVYVLWENTNTGDNNIFFKRSIDNGATFGPAVELSNDIEGQPLSHPLLSAWKNDVYVLWEDLSSGNYSILLKKSTNGGVSFEPTTILSTSTLAGGANIATVGTNVYVVWKDIVSGNYNVLFKRSTDNGATFGPAVDLSKNSTTAISNLNIATVGTNVYVLWKASSMILKRSTDNGATFGPAVDLSKYYAGLVNFDAILDLQLVTSQNNNNVYLGWNQPILSPVNYSSGTLHSDVVFGQVQPAVFMQSNFFYSQQPVTPEGQTTARGPGEQLLSLVRPQPQVQEGVWSYANYWKGPLNNLIVDELAKRKINTIYFSAPDNGGWDNSSKVLNYVDFINYARGKGMRVLGVTLEDPSFVFSTEPELKKTFGDFIKQTENIFDGYVIDVEPQTVPGADIHVYLPRYVHMSNILRNVADGYHKEFIDSVPAWYHTVLKQIGISIGINALASNRINLIDYTYPTTEAILNNINDIRSETSVPYTVNLMITPGPGAPQLSGQEIPRTIITLKSNLLPIAFDEAQYLLNLDSGLFP
ncbi:MAG: hypothetical protein DLM72_19010 [Candidatus Nitrosopolaris wilkensis]|nr:MAG: hypothetical protein DLM72_19010 [Candidatus Nitrosopolaris wilkensis]